MAEVNLYWQRFKSTAERFWEKVDRRGLEECWPWLASLDRKGYGRFQTGSRTDSSMRLAYAHRIAFVSRGRSLMNSTQGLTTAASSTALCGFCGTAYSVLWGHTCYPTVQASSTSGTLLTPEYLCPDLLRYEQIGAADGLRGRVIRLFFRIMKLWPPR